MLSIVTGNPRSMGDAMITDPHADIVTFTGSVKVGKYIAEKAGYKRLVLELGGNDPLIVMEDADLDKAAELAVQGATKNSGQRCTAVKRILVVEKVADKFAEAVLAKAKKLKSGDPMDPATDIGTVIHERAARMFEDRVNDAVAKGAKLLHGNDRKGALYPATVVDHVPYTCELVREETFGPVIPIIRCPERHRRGHQDLERHRLRPVIGRLHQSARLHHPLRQRAGGGHRQHLGGAGLSDRDEPVRGHQGFRPRLQGRRVGGHEELHQHQDLLAAMAGLTHSRSTYRHVTRECCFMFAKYLKAAAAGALLVGALAAPAMAQKTTLTIYTALENDQLADFKTDDRERPYPTSRSTGCATPPASSPPASWRRRTTPRPTSCWGSPPRACWCSRKPGLLEPYKPKGVDALKQAFRDPSEPDTWTGQDAFLGVICFNTVEGRQDRRHAADVLEGHAQPQAQGPAGDAASGVLRHGLPDGRRLAAD